MGTGHVMRCLALAEAAQEEGRRAVYAVAQCSAGVAERLRAEGIEIIDLACEPGTEQDAAATTEAARTRGADWIVLDGYHFDAAYQSAVKKSRLKLLVVQRFRGAGPLFSRHHREPGPNRRRALVPLP